jgi:hypothetical protein
MGWTLSTGTGPAPPVDAPAHVGRGSATLEEMGAPADLTDHLRREVGALRARESRRVFDPILYVGHLDGERDSFVVRSRDVPAIDRAVRVDVVGALVARVGGDPSMAWLTRPGQPALLDSDVDWMTAAGAGFAMHGRALRGFWVVTPAGWCDAHTGLSQRWRPPRRR